MAARAAKRSHWVTLNLRQDWADEAFMRGHLKFAGIRIIDNNEPATAKRLKSLLRKAGVSETEAKASVGKPLSDYLNINPNLPLWAAVALVLEATGRFTGEVKA